MIGGSWHLGDVLERAAEEDPGRLALSDAAETLTYGEMLAEARDLASSLPAGAGDPRPVATLMPSNARGVVAMLACLIAGRPYCVLNPAQPRRRLEALLGAIEPSTVWVADRSQREKLGVVGLPVAVPRARERRRPGWTSPPRGEDELAGIYVTSGSTGSPKLVAYRHTAAHHRLGKYFAGLPAGGTHDLGSGHRFALAAPLWTAAAASAVFTALSSRAELQVLDPGLGRPDALWEQVRTRKPTVWVSTPSVFRHLAGSGALENNSIRVIRLTGEPMLASDVELAQQICGPEAWLIAAYGLTETNGVATQRGIWLGDSRLSAGAIDSGYPLDGVEVRIEDEDGNLLPSGTEGEIVIGGRFLSAGYLDSGRSGTGTRFSRRGGQLVLETGDRGVLDDDGALLVKGRRDRRVKIQGYRVDPVEIEAEALRLPGVLNAVVVPFRAGEEATALALFATGGTDDSVDSPAIRSHLREVLHPEAVPAQVSVLEAIPQTPGGKVDRPRLTAMAAESARGPLGASGDVDPLMIHLASLWSEALEIESPGPEDDFFALGGDSLAAAEVCAAIEDLYGVELEPATLLEYRSPRALAVEVRRILDGASHAQAPILHLNPRGARTPVFAFHGAGGDATGLVHFAEAIGPEQPVFVVQLPGADRRSSPLSSMDEISEFCVSAIEESGVSPPYLLAGTSFGGLVAFHTAAALLQAGHEIAYVGLFDTPAPGTRRGHYLLRPLAHLRPSKLGPRDLARNRRSWPIRAGRALRVSVAEYRIVARTLLGSRRVSQVDHKFRHLRIACEMAADRWKPQALPLQVHLYRCDWQPDHLVGASRLGWDELAPEISVRNVPSRHTRHIRPPNVTQLAALVGEDLNRVRAPASA